MKIFLHIDVDGSWVIMKHFGFLSEDLSSDIVFSSGLPRIIDILLAEKIAASFFIVGKDLEIEWKREILKRIDPQLFELGNHSYLHPEGFAFLTKEEKEKEIDQCEMAIGNFFQVKPVAFRCPNFEMDIETMEIILSRGYLYDCSVFPSLLIPPLKIYHKLRMRNKQKSLYLGDSMNLFAPLSPYHPDSQALYKRGLLPIMELPVGVHPFLRIPVHLSYLRLYYAFGISKFILRSALRWYSRHNIPFCFLVHISDLADAEREREIASEIGNKMLVEDRIALFKWVLDELRKWGQIVLSRDHFFRD